MPGNLPGARALARRIAGARAVAPERVRRPHGQAMEGAFVAAGVIAAGIRQIRVERTAAVDVRSENVGIRHCPIGHRVLTGERQLTVRARDTPPSLTSDRAPAL